MGSIGEHFLRMQDNDLDFFVAFFFFALLCDDRLASGITINSCQNRGFSNHDDYLPEARCAETREQCIKT